MTIVLRWYDRTARAVDAFRADGNWIDAKDGCAAIHGHAYGGVGDWAATPTPFLETRHDGVKAQVWAVQPR